MTRIDSELLSQLIETQRCCEARSIGTNDQLFAELSNLLKLLHEWHFHRVRRDVFG